MIMYLLTNYICVYSLYVLTNRGKCCFTLFSDTCNDIKRNFYCRIMILERVVNINLLFFEIFTFAPLIFEHVHFFFCYIFSNFLFLNKSYIYLRILSQRHFLELIKGKSERNPPNRVPVNKSKYL